jgi:hypothetical protein
MLNLQSLKVKVFKTDIAPLVLSLTMYETIKGNVRGSMTVLDNINFMDTFLGTTHAPLRIEFGYQGYFYQNNFYIDGVESMVIKKSGKQYTIHFIANTTFHNQIVRINEAYSGRGDQIIKSIFVEACDGPFIKDSKSITKGRYIVPGITAHEAISHVVNTCYDENSSGMLLYQRVCEEGVTRLTSLHDMENNYFYERSLIGTVTYSTVYKLRATVAGALGDDDGIDPNQQIGTTPGFVLDEYNMNFVQKLGMGAYGNKIKNFKIDETKEEEFAPAEKTHIPKTYIPLSKKLYDNGESSVFSTWCTPEANFAINQKFRAYNQRMTAPNVVAVPGLGCGYSINVESGGSNLSKTKTDTGYIVSTINHKFTMHDGDHQYAQDIGLMRE